MQQCSVEMQLHLICFDLSFELSWRPLLLSQDLPSKPLSLVCSHFLG